MSHVLPLYSIVSPNEVAVSAPAARPARDVHRRAHGSPDRRCGRSSGPSCIKKVAKMALCLYVEQSY